MPLLTGTNWFSSPEEEAYIFQNRKPSYTKYEINPNELMSPESAYNNPLTTWDSWNDPSSMSYTPKEGLPKPGDEMSPFGISALKAGTLGADNPDFASYQQLAMKNPMAEIMSIVKGMEQQQRPAPGQAYMHPYIAQLLGGGR